MTTTLCEDCFPHFAVHEVKTIVPLSPCAQCGRYDDRGNGKLRAHLFSGDPRTNAPILTTYIGTKIIQATPMDGDLGQPGYQVVYEDGYTSWSPKDVFERAYRKTDAMSFGDALIMLEAGKKVARAGWNGKGMWLSLSGDGVRNIPCTSFWSKNNADFAASCPDGTAPVLPCITMKTAAGEILMGWLASQTDMLAKDWQVVE